MHYCTAWYWLMALQEIYYSGHVRTAPLHHSIYYNLHTSRVCTKERMCALLTTHAVFYINMFNSHRQQMLVLASNKDLVFSSLWRMLLAFLRHDCTWCANVANCSTSSPLVFNACTKAAYDERVSTQMVCKRSFTTNTFIRYEDKCQCSIHGNGWTDGQINRQTDWMMDGWMGRLTDAETSWWMDQLMEGSTDRLTDRWRMECPTERQYIILVSLHHKYVNRKRRVL